MTVRLIFKGKEEQLAFFLRRLHAPGFSRCKTTFMKQSNSCNLLYGKKDEKERKKRKETTKVMMRHSKV